LILKWIHSNDMGKWEWHWNFHSKNRRNPDVDTLILMLNWAQDSFEKRDQDRHRLKIIRQAVSPHWVRHDEDISVRLLPVERFADLWCDCWSHQLLHNGSKHTRLHSLFAAQIDGGSELSASQSTKTGPICVLTISVNKNWIHFLGTCAISHENQCSPTLRSLHEITQVKTGYCRENGRLWYSPNSSSNRVPSPSSWIAFIISRILGYYAKWKSFHIITSSFQTHLSLSIIYWFPKIRHRRSVNFRKVEVFNYLHNFLNKKFVPDYFREYLFLIQFFWECSPRFETSPFTIQFFWEYLRDSSHLLFWLNPGRVRRWMKCRQSQKDWIERGSGWNSRALPEKKSKRGFGDSMRVCIELVICWCARGDGIGPPWL
jgi:hypothetical protein